MQQIRTYAIIAFVFFACTVGLSYAFSKNTKGYVRIIITTIFVLVIGILTFKTSLLWLGVGATSLIISILISLFSKPDKSINDIDKPKIILEHSKGKIEFNNPYTGFICYGGAGSGKTSSLGKPLLSEFMRNKFALFVYDAKENDYTKTAFWLKEHLKYPYPIYNIDFVDLSRSYRFNPVAANLLDDEIEVVELATNIYKTLGKKSTLTEWDDKALGILKAAAYYLFKNHKEYFTIPHILNFTLQKSTKDLIKLFSTDATCRTYASSLIDSQGSEATLSSIKSTLSGVISSFAANKRLCYILTGNDFEYNLTDPKDPKAFFITNTFKYRNQISPLVALLFVMAMKKVQFGNKVPITAFLDEATTFKIEDLEAYPSELREYLLAMVVLTQSPAKIEKLYGKLDRSSLEANLQNQFFGRTKDNIALDIFTDIFSKKKEEQKSHTSGNGRSSTTRSKKDVKRYEKDFFIGLKAGEFVGSATDSNRGEFHVRFKEYTGDSLNQNPIVRMVSQEDIENQYNQIINNIINL